MSTPADVYQGLRGQALGLASAGLEGIPADALLLAVLMDWGLGDAVATLVGVVDGSTSLYFSHGGGIIGAGQHEQVAAAAKRWLELATSVPELFDPVEEAGLPDDGEVQFVLVTRAGLARAAASETDLRGEHPLRALYGAAQDVITQVRLVEQARRG